MCVSDGHMGFSQLQNNIYAISVQGQRCRKTGQQGEWERGRGLEIVCQFSEACVPSSCACCVCMYVCVRECVGVYVFACLHSLRVTQEETAAPILVILTPLPFLPDCPSVHIFTTRNRFPAGSKFKWANCTFTWGYSKQWADSVCVWKY